MAAEWTSSDAWIFSAIEGSGPDDGYTLAQVVGKADRINHDIPSEAEFTRAVARLLAAGLIGADAGADRYWHTNLGQALCRRWIEHGGLFSWMNVIPPALRRLGEPREATWSLPPGVFDRAVQEHLRWGQATLKRHGHRPDPGDIP